MKIKDRYLGVPFSLSIGVLGICLLGILFGSIFDWQIYRLFLIPSL
ncbi:MAG: hypothetical protein WCR56_03630 [Bacilli bacterium]|jgi:hypothetical protein